MSNGHSCGNISGIVPQNCKAYNFSLGYHKSIFFDITLNSTSSSTNTSFESYDDFFRREEDFNPYVSTHYISDQQLYVIFKNVNISDFSKPYTNCVNKIISDSVIIFKPKDVSSIMIFPKIERHYISNHWGFRS
ncbi:12006_t:CDS:1 [Entrophospora sp. SA101]|nr:12006_t:CDS:1 [Entrophospora sp. SA101]